MTIIESTVKRSDISLVVEIRDFAQGALHFFFMLFVLYMASFLEEMFN